MLPRNFNDFLALVLVAATFGLWIYVIAARIPLDSIGVVVGSTVTLVGTIASFYYRKAPPADATTTQSTTTQTSTTGGEPPPP